MILAIDFDGTCVKHKFPEIGEEIGATPILKQIVENGHSLILFTMRADNKDKRPVLTEAVNWFKERGIPLFGINENPQQKSWTESPKPYAHYYVDDTALGCPVKRDRVDERPYVDWNRLLLPLASAGFITPDQCLNFLQKDNERTLS